MSSEPAPHRLRATTLWLALGLLVLTAAIYAPVRNYAFLNYDDEEYVTENSHVNQGLSRDAAYRLTQQAAMRVWEEGGTFKERVLADPEIGKHLSQDELQKLFDLKHHLRHVDELFRRVFGE